MSGSNFTYLGYDHGGHHSEFDDGNDLFTFIESPVEPSALFTFLGDLIVPIEVEFAGYVKEIYLGVVN
jgi:hypothetical protein